MFVFVFVFVFVFQSESEKLVNQAVVVLLPGEATNSCMEVRGKKCLILTFMLLMEGSHCPRCLELRRVSNINVFCKLRSSFSIVLPSLEMEAMESSRSPFLSFASTWMPLSCSAKDQYLYILSCFRQNIVIG